jgi:hypothetical protein
LYNTNFTPRRPLRLSLADSLLEKKHPARRPKEAVKRENELEGAVHPPESAAGRRFNRGYDSQFYTLPTGELRS